MSANFAPPFKSDDSDLQLHLKTLALIIKRKHSQTNFIGLSTTVKELINDLVNQDITVLDLSMHTVH